MQTEPRSVSTGSEIARHVPIDLAVLTLGVIAFFYRHAFVCCDSALLRLFVEVVLVALMGAAAGDFVLSLLKASRSQFE